MPISLEGECPDRGQGRNEINSLIEHRLRFLTKAPPTTGLLVPWMGLYRLITKSAMQGGLRFGRRRLRGLTLEAKARIDPKSELRSSTRLLRDSLRLLRQKTHQVI